MADTTAAVVMQAWDDLVIPEMPDGPDEEVFPRYITTLKEALRDTAAEANKNEAMSQNLAAANVRQTEIISKLRAEIARLKIALMQKTLGVTDAA